MKFAQRPAFLHHHFRRKWDYLPVLLHCEAANEVKLAVEMAMGWTYMPTLKGTLILAFVAVGPSLLGQIFFIRSIELIGPSRTHMLRRGS